MSDLETLFENMNAFSQSDFLFPPMKDFASSPLGAFKFGGHDACRNGLFKTNSETVTRKKNTKEVEFERKSSHCQIQERESTRYKFTNMQHKIDVDCKTIERDDLVSQRKETSETKIFIVEKRSGANKLVLLFWKKLKRLIGLKSKTIDTISTEKIENTPQDSKMIGFVIEEPSFEEVDLRPKATESSKEGVPKKTLLSKIVFRKKKMQPTANSKNSTESNVTSEIATQVQPSGRIVEVTEMEGKDENVFQMPKIELDSNNDLGTNAAPISTKNFFVLKFNLSKKKPMAHVKELNRNSCPWCVALGPLW